MSTTPLNSSNSKVVILGSSGFAGSELLHELSHGRGYRVSGYNSATLNLLSPSCVGKLGEVVDENTLLIVTARSRATDGLEKLSDDVEIATNVARVLAKRKVKKCVYFSTLGVYSDAQTDVAVTETTKISPSSFYGIGKYTGESVLKLTARKIGIPLLIFRPCKLYGPKDPSNAYGPTGFIESILRDGDVRIYGDGRELRDHLYIDDLVKITCKTALGGHTGTYNLASGKSASFQNILGLLRKISGKDFRVVTMKRSKPKVDQRVDMTKLLSQIPGFDFTPLELGLRKSYAYFLMQNQRSL